MAHNCACMSCIHVIVVLKCDVQNVVNSLQKYYAVKTHKST